MCAAIINMFHLTPAATQKMIEPLTTLTLKGEKALHIEAGSPFHEPLMKFLLHFPTQTVDYFLLEQYIKDQQCSRFFESMLRKHEEGAPFRDVLQRSPNKLISLAFGKTQVRPHCAFNSAPYPRPTTSHTAAPIVTEQKFHFPYCV